MGQPTEIPFSQFLIAFGDGADPEVFTKAPLTMNSRGFNRTVKTTDRTTPDQANEDAVVYEKSVPDSISYELSGKGVLGKADVASWEARIGTTFDAQVQMTGVGTWTGPVILTAFNLTGERTNTVNADVTLKSADKPTWAPAA